VLACGVSGGASGDGVLGWSESSSKWGGELKSRGPTFGGLSKDMLELCFLPKPLNFGFSAYLRDLLPFTI
jgi:hypothetical protein